MIENDSFDLRKYLYTNPLLSENNSVKRSDIKKMIKEEFTRIAEADEEEDILDQPVEGETDGSTDEPIDGLEDMDFTDGGSEGATANSIEPEIEEIQQMLVDLQSKAAELAKNNPNPKDPKFAKFSTQVANTIKYFTADFIADNK